MSFFCIVAWECRVPGGVDGRIWLVECPVCVSVCLCVRQASSISIPSPHRVDFSLTLVLHTPTRTLTQWKRWHSTSNPPASRLVPNNLSPSLRDCLCVLWLFTVKWPLVLLMASYVVIILLHWNWQKVIVLCFLRRLADRNHSTTHFMPTSEQFLNSTEIFFASEQFIFIWMHI